MSLPAAPEDAVAPPLPEMREVVLTATEVEELFRDYRACTVIGGVLEKGSRRAHVEGQSPSPSLEMVMQRLVDGDIVGLQVRYRYDGYEWTDTLLNSPAGVRLVRCQHTTERAPDPHQST